MDTIAFTRNHTDHSNDNGFQFEFHCDKCGNGRMSPFKANAVGMASTLLRAAGSLFGGRLGDAANAGDHLKDALRGGARDEAFKAAVEACTPHFRHCTKCGNWVCPEACWNAKVGLCEDCAPNLAEHAASISAQVAVEQTWEKARASDQTEGIDMKQKRVAACPHCNAAVEGGKFCPSCGKPLAGKKVFCKECGKEMNAAAKFCAECGTPR
jgi:hypothetical protein